MNTVTSSFNTTMGQMTEMSQTLSGQSTSMNKMTLHVNSIKHVWCWLWHSRFRTYLLFIITDIL